MEKYRNIMDAIYTPPSLPDYDGNPFIEALPPLLEPTELYKKLYTPISYNEKERELTKC